MNLLFISLLQDAAPASNGGGMTSMLLMLGLMFVIMYFFIFRPQRKRQKQIEEFRNKLEVGSKIVTAGGVYGTVKDLNQGESYLTIEIAKGVTIQIDRNYVYSDPSQAAVQGQK